MTILMTMDLPVSRADVEAVRDALGVSDAVPPGLVAHVATETPTGTHVVDIWESEADFERFRDNQLLPTMQKVLAERSVTLDAPPQPIIEEAFDFLRGR